MQSEAQIAMSAFATQLGSISAFFGGVAATLFSLLIFVRRRSRLIEVTIAAFAGAAVCFIVCALAATFLSIGLLPGASPEIATRSYLRAVLLLMNVFFLIGIISLMSGIIMSGWLRSRLTGYVTTSVGGIGLVVVLWLSIRVS